MSKLKPYIRRCLCSMILAAFSSCAVAQVVSVEAKGKDEKVARTNACVAAARQMMIQMTEDSFVKSHTKQIRSEIISKADSFVTSVKITEQKQNGKTLVIRADVDVDRTVLAGALSAMGATIVKSYADVLEERRKNETEGLKTIFGHDVALQTAAVPLKPVNGIRPVTTSRESYSVCSTPFPDIMRPPAETTAPIIRWFHQMYPLIMRNPAATVSPIMKSEWIGGTVYSA